MYANYLLDSYKKAMNYVQDKQIAHDLNIPQQRISEMRKGKRYISDSEAVFMAEHANIDPREALLGCHSDRNDNPKLKQLWADIAKKLNSQGIQAFSMAFLASGLVVTSVLGNIYECALCIVG
ncbi:DUF3693 domain-containing protein [Photobacterium alginatilyticum]|uniref:Uncharacterized protein n=1 Tax=Photobacterium alginatilyticum TaxID=1775171 RepID=A0ABW9YP84_9GAMM|nr:DUF3693 domain-containing protein [Photobacterium alginatilyticum]NBI55470.1 hypothetical protein [Photobacterium alginatilyticum]